MTRTLVVIGNGMVGHHLVRTIGERASDWRIVVLAEEPRPAYDRVALSSYVDGWDAATLTLPAADAEVEVRLGDPVTEIDRAGREVVTASGFVQGYDALVLATGSYPFVPPVPGHDRSHCFVYRTIDDLDAIRAAALGAGVVIGGGLLGLEAANALRLMGMRPQVVELAPRLMPLQVDEGGSALLRREVRALGLDVHCGVSVSAVEDDHVVLSDGSRLPADIVVFSAGVRPRDDLARRFGLEVGERGGIVVDETCRTSDESIYAIGECACVGGRVYGLVATGYAMAEVVADRLLAGDKVFPGADTSTKLKLLGVDIASFGDAHAASPGALEVVHNDPVAGTYKKVVVSDDASTLPDDAQVCSCHGVTKAAIVTAIGTGCADVPALKACTKVGTGCGSCVPTLKQLLTSCGVEQSKALCEHFSQSRAELFEIIRATGIRTLLAERTSA
jgi:nitrite reductase (NADH) large subunit